MAQRLINYLLRNQVILALVLIILGWFFLETKTIFVSIFISYIIMAALLPFVNFLRRRGLPKILAVVLAYSIVLFFIFLLIFPLIPFFVSQVQSLILGFPVYLDQSARTLGFEMNPEQVQSYIGQEIENIGANAFFVTQQIFGGLFSTLTIFIVSFYLLLDHDTFKHAAAKLFHKEYRERVYETLQLVDVKLGAWLRGQMFLSVFIGVLTWVVLTVLGLSETALPLAVIAGILEIIPTLGPIIAAIPAVIVALTISPGLAIAVVIAYTFIQLLENNVLVPKIMEHAVGLNPIIVILAVMTGAHLMGVTGALLSIPFVSFVIVLLHSVRAKE